MAHDLAKEIKSKVDAMKRMSDMDHTPSIYEGATGINNVSDPASYTQPLAEGKNIQFGTAGAARVINAIMNLIAGDNISISAPDPATGAVTITGTVGGKGINMAGLQDKFVMAYDLATDTIIFTEMVGGSGGSSTAADVSIADAGENFTAENVEGALAELFTSVSDGKTLIAGAITDKGISTSPTDTFSTMAINISTIPQEGGGGGGGYSIGWNPVFYNQIVLTTINKPV